MTSTALVRLVQSLLLALCFAHGAAFAHTSLVSSVPAADASVSTPAALTLTFGGQVSLLRLTVVGPAGEVDIGFTARTEPLAQHEVKLPPLPAGRYVVDWTIVGEDGHSISKSFSFTVTAG